MLQIVRRAVFLAYLSKLLEDDIRILAADEITKGHHGRDIFFMHPKDALGTLIEIEQTDN